MRSRLPFLLLSMLLGFAIGGCSDSEEPAGPEDEVQCRADQAQCGSLCVRLDANPFHCGACGEACGEGEFCDEGSCVIACANGRVDCEGGCFDLQTDDEHCGACGSACGKDQRCWEGSCQDKPVVCEGEEVACAGGCTDLSKDPANCGACGKACGDGESCQAGACVAEPITCDTGKTLCGATCVDTTSDLEHCGQCDLACSGGANAVGPTCAASACGLVCEDTFDNCDGDLANGCETTLIDNDEHCGRCGNDCGDLANVADAFCWETTCTVVTCGAGWGNCDGSDENGCETDTNNSIDNCGGCGVDCTQLANNTAVPACNAGACALECAPGYGDCDGDFSNGCELSLDSPQNCGACGNACDEHEQCVEGGCQDRQRAEWPVPSDSPTFVVDEEKGLITEPTTGLMWQLREPGEVENREAFSADLCAGSEWGGYNDWRVPTILELMTIVDHTKQFPSIDNKEVFTFIADFESRTFVANTVSVGSYQQKGLWSINTMLGMVAQANFPSLLMCVRGGIVVPGVARYVYEPGGLTVYTPRTNLTWQRESQPAMNWDAAAAYCEALSLDGVDGWRLPTVKELLSLIDYRREAPAVDWIVFRKTYPDPYWSGTGANGSYQSVHFGAGTVAFPESGTNERYVRCVRDGKLPAAGE